MRSLEAVIGILLILSVFLVIYNRDVQLPELDTVNYKLRGFAALKTLDETGELRQAVALNDTQAVTNKLSDILPQQLNTLIVFCETDCALPAVSSEKIISLVYLVAGEVNSLKPKQVILYLW